MPRAFSGNLSLLGECPSGLRLLSASRLGFGVFHHSRLNLSGITSHGHTAMGVSCRAGERTPPHRLRRSPALGSRGSANSRTGLRTASSPIPLPKFPRPDAGPPSCVPPPLASPLPPLSPFPSRLHSPPSLPLARASHRSSASTPPSRSHMFMRIASPSSMYCLRLILRFHRSSRRMRRCSVAIRATSAASILNSGSRRSSSTTRSTASSSTPMRAHREATSRSCISGGVRQSCASAFQSVMRAA